MDASVEPTALRRFEIREGIEMVPGTVHLIDSMLLTFVETPSSSAEFNCGLRIACWASTTRFYIMKMMANSSKSKETRD